MAVKVPSLFKQSLHYIYGTRFQTKPLITRIQGWRCNSNDSKSPPGKYAEDEGKPLKYTTSQASTWKAKHTREGTDEDIPWYQGLVISLSMGVFLLYFCVFREESDIDEELGRSLYSRIEGLEESQLKISLEYNKEHGLDTQAIEQRLREIQQDKM